MGQQHIIAISDLHGELLDDLPACDLLIIAGDLCPLHNHEVAYQRDWINQEFNPWFATQRATQRIYIAGNHDFVFEQDPDGVEKPRHYLQDRAVTLNGLKFWGSPWSRACGLWAFGKEERDLPDIWEQIPTDIDILITHGPAYRARDMVLSGDQVGSVTLRNWIDTYEPRVHICGHIHEAAGLQLVGRTLVVNAAIRDRHYIRVNDPVELWV